MQGGRFFRAVLGTAVIAAVISSAALGASPREIYADFADNSQLDRQYSAADLQQALQDAEGQGYPKAGAGPARVAIQAELGKQDSQSGGVAAVGTSGGTLPFTGVDLALLTAGAGLLLVLGWGFRRYGRDRA